MKLSRRTSLKIFGAIPFIPGLVEVAMAARATDRHFILLWMDGGMSHIDTLDPKPEAGADIRGPLDVVRTSLPGVMFTEPLKDLAKLMDRCCLVRSLTSPEGNHDRGSHYMLTGHRPSSLVQYPSIGSVVASQFHGDIGLPPYVAIPESHEFGREGFLPAHLGPFDTGGDPGKPGFRVKNLEPHTQSEAVLSVLDTLRNLQSQPLSQDELDRGSFLNQARLATQNSFVRDLFDLGQESSTVRESYGHHKLGQSCLLARRLVEGGVRVVQVRDTGWDHHVNINQALTYGFPPKLTALNQALSQLILDLERRGLDSKVTVMLASEFGRTPRLNPSGGRDHWSRASSALIYGGGFRRGQVFGETDARGEEPVFRPVSPADLFSTLLASLGMSRDERFVSTDGRPIPVMDPQSRILDDLLIHRA